MDFQEINYQKIDLSIEGQGQPPKTETSTQDEAINAIAIPRIRGGNGRPNPYLGNNS